MAPSDIPRMTTPQTSPPAEGTRERTLQQELQDSLPLALPVGMGALLSYAILWMPLFLASGQNLSEGFFRAAALASLVIAVAGPIAHRLAAGPLTLLPLRASLLGAVMPLIAALVTILGIGVNIAQNFSRPADPECLSSRATWAQTSSLA